MASARLPSIFHLLNHEITADNAWDLWQRGKISDQMLADFLAKNDARFIDRNWGSNVLHIKVRDSKKFPFRGKAKSFDISGKDEDTVRRLDMLIPELERAGIRIGKEEGLRDAPKWRISSLGKVVTHKG